MSRQARSSLALLFLTALAAACGGSREESEELIGEAPSAIVNSNALNPNALNPNALNPNALNPNALNPNALVPEAVAAIQDPGESGELSRQLLRYIVSCALDKTQSFSFSWTDEQGLTHDELYQGELGLAPSWLHVPLGDEESQRWVSACLASRVNRYGISVMLSSRGAHPSLSVDSFELANYTRVEGAFWGNLFSAPFSVSTCYDATNAEHSRSLLRDCAAGRLSTDPVTQEVIVEECGPLKIVGACAALCDPPSGSGSYYPKCPASPSANNGKTSIVITTYLP